jgi:hypothetical protein
MPRARPFVPWFFTFVATCDDSPLPRPSCGCCIQRPFTEAASSAASVREIFQPRMDDVVSADRRWIDTALLDQDFFFRWVAVRRSFPRREVGGEAGNSCCA